MKYSISPTANGVTFQILDTPPVQLVRYAGELIPVEEAVSILLCAGHSVDYCFEWLERRLKVGRFAPKEVLQ